VVWGKQLEKAIKESYDPKNLEGQYTPDEFIAKMRSMM
jgi:hypothetical protein